MREIFVASLVSARTGDPLVELSIDDHKVQLSVEEAQKIALDLLGAAEAAQSDVILLKFLRGLGVPEGNDAVLLQEFRMLRARREEEVKDNG